VADQDHLRRLTASLPPIHRVSLSELESVSR
jgi:hypothetical protein